MRKLLHTTTLLLISTLLAAQHGLLSASRPNVYQPAAQLMGESSWRTFRYRMAGRVRLLFFWVGRADVGGGAIGLLQQTRDAAPEMVVEGVKVLFGSDPKRVPGKINRWGYGQEVAYWSRDPRKHEDGVLESTFFEGFMSHSSEESLGEVRQKSAADKAGGEFWYDGIQSKVTRDAASSTVHFFSQTEDFDYTRPGGVECAYRERLRNGAPDRDRTLKRAEFPYESPYGFLTAVRALVETLCARPGQQAAVAFAKHPAVKYVYNAKPYEIVVSEVSRHRQYRLPGSGKASALASFQDVVEAEFQTTNIQTRETHNFTLWFPTSGPMRGIPLRIVDKPRWWLRVELTLDPESARQGGSPQRGGAMPGCDR